MGNPLILDDFSSSIASTPAGNAGSLSEDARLEAFEEGYKAGWDDMIAAQEKDSNRIGDDLARNLSDLSFTYHEVRTNILQALRPLLHEIIGKVLPVTATASLPELINEHVESIADRSTQLPVAIAVHPDLVDAVEAIVPHSSSLPISTVGDETLSSGQAMIKFSDQEHQIDLDGAIVGMNAALQDFFDAEFKEQANGTN